jgi:hypothetical protein
MAKFDVGNRVQMPGIPLAVEVLELGTCDIDACSLEPATFRFKDPETGVDDWAHVSEFEKVPAE